MTDNDKKNKTELRNNYSYIISAGKLIIIIYI